MMVAVAVTALDFGLIARAVEVEEENPCTSFIAFPAMVFVPSMSLIAVAALNSIYRLARCGRASPFATGYFLFGCLGSLCLCLDLAAHTNLLFSLTAFLDPAPGPNGSVSDRWVGDLLSILIYALSQVAIALIGVLVAARYGMQLVLSGRNPAPTGQETV